MGTKIDRRAYFDVVYRDNDRSTDFGKDRTDIDIKDATKFYLNYVGAVDHRDLEIPIRYKALVGIIERITANAAVDGRENLKGELRSLLGVDDEIESSIRLAMPTDNS